MPYRAPANAIVCLPFVFFNVFSYTFPLISSEFTEIRAEMCDFRGTFPLIKAESSDVHTEVNVFCDIFRLMDMLSSVE